MPFGAVNEQGAPKVPPVTLLLLRRALAIERVTQSFYRLKTINVNRWDVL
jgi:hypothetical protein